MNSGVVVFHFFFYTIHRTNPWFLNSDLVCGNLGKSCLAGRGLFYALLREHGETSAAWAMNRLTKMCTRWLSLHGFTIGIDDVIPPARLIKEKIYSVFFF